MVKIDRVLFSLALLIPPVVVPLPSWAAGFAITAQGASASGKSNAFVAQADDPSAIFYNPAGMSQLTGSRIILGVAAITPRTSYAPDSGAAVTHQKDQTFFMPQLYATRSLGPRMVGGIGVFVPFGLATDWPEDWEGRFQATHVSIRSSVVSPALSWQPVEWLAVGGGLDVHFLQLEQRKALNLETILGVPGIPEGAVSLKGDGTGLGFSAGMLLKPSSVLAIGGSFRSHARAEIDSRADFTAPGFEPFFPDGAAQTAVDLPPSARVGVLVRPSPRWNVEADAHWMGWSTIDRVVVRFDSGLPDDRTEFGWKDSWTYNLGTEYRLPSSVVARAGYSYDATPIPDETVSPILPDGNRQWISAGIGYRTETFDINLGYSLILFHRVKRNDVGNESSMAGPPPLDARANGRYATRAHSVVIGLERRF